MLTTSLSLLERLRNPGDQQAWTRFVQLYTPLLVRWSRHWGMQANDGADLIQDVLCTLFQKMPDFLLDRNRSFRAWLHTVTRNRWRDRLRSSGSRPLPAANEELATLPARDGWVELQEAEYRTHLVDTALRLVQPDFAPTTWQAFWQFAVEGRPVAEVARELGLSPASIYGAKFRVIDRLRQELDGFLDD